MQIRRLNTIIAILLFSFPSFSQNDFSVLWNAYTTDDTITDNPFSGSFTIRNEGENVIPVNDTLWYGYLIEDEKYDLGINFGLVSGQVLDEDFEPGAEIIVINNFTWTDEWASEDTIDICAAVYGVGISSYEEMFSGDDDISNNTDCVRAVIPPYAVSIDDQMSKADLFNVYASGNELVVLNTGPETVSAMRLQISNVQGKHVHSEVFNAYSGVNNIATNVLSTGIYIVNINFEGETIKRKIFIP